MPAEKQRINQINFDHNLKIGYLNANLDGEIVLNSSITWKHTQLTAYTNMKLKQKLIDAPIIKPVEHNLKIDCRKFWSII